MALPPTDFLRILLSPKASISATFSIRKNMNRCHPWSLSALLCILGIIASPGRLQGAAESFGDGKRLGDRVLPASDEAAQAIKKFNLATGLRAEVWAAEPDVANIVSFSFDSKGQAYVVETFRHSDGVTDIRGHMGWLDEELASQSVEDRINILRKHESSRLDWYTRYSDRVRKVWDATGSGKATRSTVFSDGYNGIPDGLASGVLPWRGSVYFANIPHLWKLQDADGDGIAEVKKSLLYGFGVRTGFLGHDLHGLTIGPDGKLYFTIGDRGAHINTVEGRVVANHESGAVYRCHPDGTGLEIFATGLRNPQEIAFDDFGNWFTGDNNSDGGDPARWVHLVEGGNSGWHIGFQFIDSPNSRGPWIAEKMCYPQNPEQPAYVLPPLANFTSGPAGLAYYPGTGLPDRYQRHFFLVDFTGGKGSGVHSFSLKPKGASYEVVDPDHLIREILATDVEFGPEPGIFVSDWVQGWDKPGKGRIYRIFNPAQQQDALSRDVKNFLARGLSGSSLAQLKTWLGHEDRRIRLEAQFTLVDRGADGLAVLSESAQSSSNQIARIHGIWGLSQGFERASDHKEKTSIAEQWIKGLEDSDFEIRAQMAKALGDAGWISAAPALDRLCADSNPRVKLLAGIALAKLGLKGSVAAFIQLARQNESSADPYLRHAAAFGLERAGDVAALVGLAGDSSAEVRRTAVVALRRMQNEGVRMFLKDARPDIVLEAARAISDLPIVSALPDLATLNPSADATPPLWRRVLNAHYRLGRAEDAQSLANWASQASVPDSIRLEALRCIAQWAKPSGRDRVTGLWRPIEPRDLSAAQASLKPLMPGLLASGKSALQTEVARIASLWGSLDLSTNLLALLENKTADAGARVQALKTMAELKSPQLSRGLEIAGDDAAEALRVESTRIQGQAGGSQALKSLQRALDTGSTKEQQMAFSTLGGWVGGQSEPILEEWMNRLLKGKVSGPLQLDLLEAVGKRSSSSLQSRLKQFNASRKTNETTAGFVECLEGGDAVAGRKIFYERADVACVKCHKVQGEGGEVGPELTGLGTRSSRAHILEGIVAPNAQIAVGFETVLVTQKDGNAYAGQLKKETDAELIINSPEDGLLTVKKSEITSRERGLSGMPAELYLLLSKQDIRDLVEFIYTSSSPRE